MLPCSHAPMRPVVHIALAIAGLVCAWAQPGWAQISFDASSTTGGAIRPGFATTCNAAALGALRTNVGALERCDGSAWGAVGGAGGASTSDRVVSTSANIVVGNGGTISFTTGGVSGTAYFDTVGRLVVPGISTTGVISTTALTVNGVAITGSGVDDTPNVFNFSNLSNQSAFDTVSSNIITVAGLSSISVRAAVDGGPNAFLSIEGGDFVRRAPVVEGQTVQVWISTSTVGASSSVAFINIGNISDTWVVTTGPVSTISVTSASFRSNSCFGGTDRTSRVRTLCDGRISCSVAVNTTNLSPDPCSGNPKTFSASYTCSPAGTSKNTPTYSEGQNALLICP